MDGEKIFWKLFVIHACGAIISSLVLASAPELFLVPLENTGAKAVFALGTFLVCAVLSGFAWMYFRALTSPMRMFASCVMAICMYLFSASATSVFKISIIPSKFDLNDDGIYVEFADLNVIESTGIYVTIGIAITAICFLCWLLFSIQMARDERAIR